MNLSSYSFPVAVIPEVVVYGVWILTAIVHIAFALAVHTDAQVLRKPFLVEARFWALATLLGGVLVAAIYWLIHYSTLRPAQPPTTAAAEPFPPKHSQ